MSDVLEKLGIPPPTPVAVVPPPTVTVDNYREFATEMMPECIARAASIVRDPGAPHNMAMKAAEFIRDTGPGRPTAMALEVKDGDNNIRVTIVG